MRTHFLIAVLAILQFAKAQESFYDVYNSTLNTQTKYHNDLSAVDSIKNIDFMEREIRQTDLTSRYFAEMDKLPLKLENLSFPDISFSDLNNQSLMISDLAGELVINFTYPNCLECVSNLLDSIQKRTAKRNIKILVLFTEPYRKKASLLKQFNENVMIGFVTLDTRDLITLKQDDDCMFFVDTDHRIEFFRHRQHKEWTKFLDKRLN